MLDSVYAVLAVCCTQCMLNSVYAVLRVNPWSWHGEIERDDLTSYFYVMPQLRTRKKEMWGDGTNYHEKLRLQRISWESQFTIPDMAGMRHNMTCNNTNTRSSKPNQASRTADFASPLISSTSFSSSSPSLSFSSTTLPSSPHTQLSHPSLFLSGRIMSWHYVPHPMSTVSTQDCTSSLHSHEIKSWPLNVELASSVPPYTIYCPQRAPHESSNVELTHWRIEFQHPPQCPLTTSKYSSNLTQSCPSSLSPNSLDHGPQAHLHSRSIMASKFISRLPRLRPASFHDQSLEVHLHIRSITASKCISPNFLHHGLQVHLQTYSIMASRCISRVAGLRPATSHNHVPQLHLQTRSITISEWIPKFSPSWPPSVSPKTLDYPLQVHLQTCSIMALECISEFPQSSFWGAPRIALKHCLQPVQIYGV